MLTDEANRKNEHQSVDNRQGDQLEIHWIIDGVLALSKYPRTRHLAGLYDKGIRAIVSLEKRPDKDHLNRYEYREVCVKDYTAPTVQQMIKINKFIDSMSKMKKPVLVHCFEGGRSGTVVAGYLIHKGMSLDEAIRTVRNKVPNAIETNEQMQSLKTLESRLKFEK